MPPISEKAINNDAGPPDAKALPDPTNKPVPILPPMAIICRWRPFNFLASGEFAVFAAASSKLNVRACRSCSWSCSAGDAPSIIPCVTLKEFGSRLKLSFHLRNMPGLRE